MTRRSAAYEVGRVEGIKTGLEMAEKFIALTKSTKDAGMMIRAALLTLTGKDMANADTANGLADKPARPARPLRPKRHAGAKKGSGAPDRPDRAGDEETQF